MIEQLSKSEIEHLVDEALGVLTVAYQLEDTRGMDTQAVLHALTEAEQHKQVLAQTETHDRAWNIKHAAPEMVRAKLQRAIEIMADSAVRSCGQSLVWDHNPKIDFPATRKNALAAMRLPAHATYDDIAATVRANYILGQKREYGLPASASFDAVIMMQSRRRPNQTEPAVNGSRETSTQWDNDLDYGVPAADVVKWKEIKLLRDSIEDPAGDSPLRHFAKLIAYFDTRHRHDRYSPEDDDRDPYNVRELMHLLQQTPWELIDRELDRDRRNNTARMIPELGKDPSWENIMQFAEALYGRVYMDVGAIEDARSRHSRVCNIRDRVHRVVAERKLPPRTNYGPDNRTLADTIASLKAIVANLPQLD